MITEVKGIYKSISHNQLIKLNLLAEYHRDRSLAVRTGGGNLVERGPARRFFSRLLLLVPNLVYDRRIDFRLSPFVDAARLRCGNSFRLAFLPQAGRELGEHPQACRGSALRAATAW
jgi:hypothetical protein